MGEREGVNVCVRERKRERGGGGGGEREHLYELREHVHRVMCVCTLAYTPIIIQSIFCA